MTADSRTVPTFTSGGVTSATMEKLPKGYIARGYADSSQSGITGETTLADLSSVAFTTAAGRRLEVKVSCHVQAGTADKSWTLKVKDGATTLFTVTGTVPVASKDQFVSYSAMIDGWTAGSHTLNTTLASDDGTTAFTMSAASSKQAQISVSDVGPT